VIGIRLVRDTDAPAIAQVRRDSWYAAYEGIIPTPIIDRATALGAAAATPPPYRRTVVAEAGEHPAVIGYASFGPERVVATAFASALPATAANPFAGNSRPAAGPPAGNSRPAAGPPAGNSRPAADPLLGNCSPAASPLTPDGLAGLVGELYALYVSPDWWSTGAGRALMGEVLTCLEAEGYRRAILWVLADNTRARRFYERAKFTPDGGINVLTGLGGVLEVRYTRDL
jgi:GNAT superfamily N-acetyltransferase